MSSGSMVLEVLDERVRLSKGETSTDFRYTAAL